MTEAALEYTLLPPHCGPFESLPPFPERAPRFALFSLPGATRTPRGRHEVRQSILHTLKEWSGREMQLHETISGPIIQALAQGQSIHVSISYSGSGAWFAIALGEPIGVDAVSLWDCKGWEDIAAIYLPECISKTRTKDAEAELRFAHEWASLEARFKRAGLPLTEDIRPPSAEIYATQKGQTVIAIAFGEKAKS